MQQEQRIKNLFYALFGGTFFVLLVLIGGYFLPTGFGYRKLQTDIATQESTIQSQRTIADRLGSAQEAKVKAQIDAEAAGAQLAYFQNRYFAVNIGNIAPDPTLPDPYGPLYRSFDRFLYVYRGGVNPPAGLNIGDDYGTVLQNELDNAVRDSGVAYANAKETNTGTSSGGDRDSGGGGGSTTVEAGRPTVVIPADLAPKNPEDLPGFIPTNGLLTPVARIGDMAVRGDLGSILRFFQIITSNRSTVVKTISGVRMEGNSPNIIATFSLSPYLIIKGASAPITATYSGAAGGTTTPGTTPGTSPGP